MQSYTFRQKAENFLYHYKFHTIAVCFVIFVIVWAIVTSIGKEGGEVSLGYIGEYSYSNSEIDALGKKMSDILKLDVDGDGKSNIQLNSYHYYSAEQIKELGEKAKENNEDAAYYPVLNEKNYQYFVTELENGNTAVWFVSKEVYEMMDKSSLMTIEDALGYIPEKGAVDKYAIDCSTLRFSAETTREVTFNTYLIIRGNRVHSFIQGEEESRAELERSLALYQAIVEYKK
jgi:hypothetical protein